MAVSAPPRHNPMMSIVGAPVISAMTSRASRGPWIR